MREYPDYKPIIDKVPPSLVKRAFDQLLNIKRNPVLPEEIDGAISILSNI